MIKTFMDIKAFKDKTVNLICRGSSGAIIAGIFSISIPNKNKIIHIKKRGEASHSESAWLGGAMEINLIVDDFMCSGETLNAIYEALQSANRDKNIKIDCLCLSGKVEMYKLRFRPKHLICGDVEE